MVLVDVAMLVVGIILLVKFSDIVINNAIKFSEFAHISQATVGFIFIAVSTSLPELTIGIISSLSGNSLLSVGNLIGANVANMTLVFGAMAFFGFNMGRIYSKGIQDALVWTSFIAMVLVLAGSVNLVFGVFCLSLFYLFARGIAEKGVSMSTGEKLSTIDIVKHSVYLVLSVIAVSVSAYIITNSAIALAAEIGVAESIIGATILAMGTTLPELTINVTAVRRGNIGLAMGDMIGSIVTNMTLIIGIVSIIGSISITHAEAAMATFLTGINIIFYFLTSRYAFGIKQAGLLLLVYISFILFSLGIL